jgi:hypothetical protein
LLALLALLLLVCVEGDGAFVFGAALPGLLFEVFVPMGTTAA